MRPRVMVDYDREPYVFESGEVRITFDKHVRAGFGTFDLLRQFKHKGWLYGLTND